MNIYDYFPFDDFEFPKYERQQDKSDNIIDCECQVRDKVVVPGSGKQKATVREVDSATVSYELVEVIV